jgi:hypothetical protein
MCSLATIFVIDSDNDLTKKNSRSSNSIVSVILFYFDGYSGSWKSPSADFDLQGIKPRHFLILPVNRLAKSCCARPALRTDGTLQNSTFRKGIKDSHRVQSLSLFKSTKASLSI